MLCTLRINAAEGVRNANRFRSAGHGVPKSSEETYPFKCVDDFVFVVDFGFRCC